MSALEEGTPPASAAVRAELKRMKLRALQQRAEELGVGQEQLDDAEDKSEVIDLVLAALADEAQRHAALKDELTGMKLRVLQKRAEELGVDEQVLNDADDKAEVVALILAATPAITNAGAEAAEAARLAQLRDELLRMKLRALQKRAIELGANETALDAAEDKLAVVELIMGQSAAVGGAAAAAAAAAETEQYNCTPFEQENEFPDGIFSYASGTDGGKGEANMWAVANGLRAYDITTYNSKMVKAGQHWRVEWFGILARAKFAVVIPSDAYWQSQQCVDELEAILHRNIPVFLLRGDVGFTGRVPKGDFLGTADANKKLSGFFQTSKQLAKNCLPGPDCPLFHDNKAANCE